MIDYDPPVEDLRRLERLASTAGASSSSADEEDEDCDEDDDWDAVFAADFACRLRFGFGTFSAFAFFEEALFTVLLLLFAKGGVGLRKTEEADGVRDWGGVSSSSVSEPESVWFDFVVEVT